MAMAERTPARELLADLVVGGEDLPLPAHTDDPLDWEGYHQQITEARETTGIDEAVIAVRGPVAGDGPPAVFVAWDFRFLGGSMGAATGERISMAVERATEDGLPVVLLPATGGARMQEGMASLVQMAATAVAMRRHAAAGLLRVSVLRDPTTGGVFASHANLTDVAFAEPGATIGFAGPRVAEAMTDGPLPSGSHTAEGARAAGLVDDVVPIDELADRLRALLSWPGVADPHGLEVPDGDRLPVGDAWEQVQRARADDRARADAFLAGLEVAAELHGDRAGTDDPVIRVALARLAGRPVVVIAMDRSANAGRISPGGYRKAWRGIRLAERVGVPVVTLIDTPGADAGAASEAGGIAHHIARTVEQLLQVRTPVVSCTIGEGGSGGALALAVGDRLLIQEHAVFSVIGPEGAAAILHRDVDKAPEVARRLRLTAVDLVDMGIGDEVVPEPVGSEVRAALATVAAHLDELSRREPEELVDRRLRRWRRAGSHHR